MNLPYWAFTTVQVQSVEDRDDVLCNNALHYPIKDVVALSDYVHHFILLAA